MKGQFDFEVKEGYLLLNITGTYDRIEFLSLPETIKIKCEKEKIYKVLIDGRDLKGSKLSTTDKFFLGEKIGLEFQSDIKIAIVWSAAYIDKFAETVALNRGGDMFVTSDYKAAEDWLQNSP